MQCARFRAHRVLLSPLASLGKGDAALRAFDKSTGRELWSYVLPGPANGTPMTYRTASGRQHVVVATGGGRTATLVAFR